MKSSHCALVLAAFLLGGAASGLAADLPPERASFFADGIVQIADERLTFDIAHRNGMERQEMNIDGLFQITILRPDLGTAYLVQPEGESSIVLPLDEIGIWPRYRGGSGYAIERIGEEDVDGEAAEVFRVVSDEDAPTAMDVLVWISWDGIELRMEGEMEVEGLLESVVVERRNVRRGPVDEALFDPEAAMKTEVQSLQVPASHESIGKIGP